MEPARCQICNKPMTSWLEICNQLCVCMKCASTVTLSDLSGIGYAKVKPDTFVMDGETLVTKEEPEVINYADAIKKFQEKGMIVKGEYTQGAMNEIRQKSYDWTIEEIVQYIKDLGFATEAAFNTHCSALIEGGYTEETSYALILYSRYNEQTVCDEIGTHYNALEGQTEEEAISEMLAACRVEDAILTEEQKAKLDANAEYGKAVMDSLVTKDSGDTEEIPLPIGCRKECPYYPHETCGHYYGEGHMCMLDEEIENSEGEDNNE